jgi:hypothetical protein
MTSAASPQGRRIVVAEVTGEAGRRIQAWRKQHDPEQARRLPPHSTLCYWAPHLPADELEQQVQHAFKEPVSVRLGCVKQGDNDQATLYVEVRQADALDSALQRLYDGTHVKLPSVDHWRWHVTCVRDTRGRDMDSLWAAARKLELDCAWRVDKVSYLELNGDRYDELACWRV